MKGVVILLLCAVSLAQADQANCDPAKAPRICAAQNSDGVLVAHENCNQFYKCANGVPVALNCWGNLLYNPYKGECDWPENVECERHITDIDNGGNNGGNGGTGTCNCNPGEASGICAAPGSNGILIAHEKCNKFYKCAYGRPVAMNCQTGLLYNPYTEQCDWPHNVNCRDKPIVEIDNGGDDKDESKEDNVGTCNCNPGEAPGICAAPGSNGILIAHEKCNKFYKCDHGAPVTFTCHSGLLYNPYTEECDWAHNVKCGDRPIPETDNGGDENDKSEEENEGTCNCNPGEAPGICAAPGSNGILIAHEKCNKFYKCDHGAPVTFTCHSGLLYNPYTEECDWAHNVKCGDRPIPETDNGGDENDKSEEENEGTCNCNPGEAPGICAAPGSNGILIAHEKCNKFYKCDHGAPVTFTCHSGLLYNPYTEECDWAHNVKCGDRPIPETDNGGDENDKSEEENEGTCNCNPGEAPGICAAPGSNGILIAHEKCNKFYKCDHGAPVTFTCHSGLLYNPYTEECDWAHNVKCGDRPIPETDNGGDENDKSEEENVGTCNCNPGEAPGICAAPGSNGILIAHEKCNKFYKCAYGRPVAMNCQTGLLYNPYTEQCDWPHNVNCRDKPIVEIDNGGDDKDESKEENVGTCNCNPGEAPGICAAPKSNGILIAHEKCNKFYKCAFGKPVALNCNAGLLYNPYTEQCDWPHNVKCGDRHVAEIDNGNNESEDVNTCNCDPRKAPGICAAPGTDGILIAHEECNKFYQCSYGKPVALTCQAGLLYNPYAQVCDWPHNVNCGDRPIPEPDNGGNESEEENGGSCNCNPGEAPGICAAPGSNGILIAHEKCDKFYKCSDGEPVALNCQTGLLYNPYTESCDWPHNVNCGDRRVAFNKNATRRGNF